MIRRVAIPARFLHAGPQEGMGRYTAHLLHALASHVPGVEFDVITDRVPDAAHRFPANVRLHRVGPPARHPLLYYLWYHLRLPVAIRRLQPDVVFVPEPFAVAGIPYPQVLTVHDLAFWAHGQTKDRANRWYYNRYVPPSLQKAAQLVCISEATRTEVRSYQPGVGAKATVVANGVNDRFSPQPPEAVADGLKELSLKRPYLLTVGAIEPRKNLVRTLKAFDAAVAEGIDHQLVIAGRWAWKYKPIQRALQRLRHPGRVTFLGYVPDVYLPALYSGATALVYLSYYEGFGLPIAEAARCGTPAVIANQSAPPEVAGPGGLPVDPFSVEAIKAALLQVTTSTEFRQALAAAALQHSQRFTWTNAADGTWQAIEAAYSTVG